MTQILWDLAPGLVIRACTSAGTEQLRYTPNATTTFDATSGPRPTRVGPIGFSEAQRVERTLWNWERSPLELGVYKTLPVQWMVASTYVTGSSVAAYNSTSLHKVLAYARGGNGTNRLEISLNYGFPGSWRRVTLEEYTVSIAGGSTAPTMYQIDAVFKQTAISNALPDFRVIGSGKAYVAYGAQDGTAW